MTKHRYSRRGFIGLSGAGVAGLVGAQWPGAAAADNSTQDPDLVVFNAKVYTVDPLEPRAQAFAVKAGRFVAVGSSEDVKSLIGKRTQAFDAKQMTIVPGLPNGVAKLVPPKGCKLLVACARSWAGSDPRRSNSRATTMVASLQRWPQSWLN